MLHTRLYFSVVLIFKTFSPFHYILPGEFCQFNKEKTSCPKDTSLVLPEAENPCGSRGVCEAESGKDAGFRCKCPSGTDTEYCKLSARHFPEGSYIAVPGTIFGYLLILAKCNQAFSSFCKRICHFQGFQFLYRFPVCTQLCFNVHTAVGTTSYER